MHRKRDGREFVDSIGSMSFPFISIEFFCRLDAGLVKRAEIRAETASPSANPYAWRIRSHQNASWRFLDEKLRHRSLLRQLLEGADVGPDLAKRLVVARSTSPTSFGLNEGGKEKGLPVFCFAGTTFPEELLVSFFPSPRAPLTRVRFSQRPAPPHCTVSALWKHRRLQESCSIPGREYDTGVSAERPAEEHGNAFCLPLSASSFFFPFLLFRRLAGCYATPPLVSSLGILNASRVVVDARNSTKPREASNRKLVTFRVKFRLHGSLYFTLFEDPGVLVPNPAYEVANAGSGSFHFA